MSRLDEALRRAGQGSGKPETFNAPRSRALEWFAVSSEEAESARAAQTKAPAEPAQPPVQPPRTVSEASAILATSVLDAPSGATTMLSIASPASFEEKLIVSASIDPLALEQYRRLAAELHHAQQARGIRVVMVSSAAAGEGKTLTAANLALTISESYHRRVLLVDADLRRPMVHEVLGLQNRGGLNETLNAAGDRKLSVVPVSARLAVLPAGRPNPDPMSSLTSERMKRVIAEAAERFDWVVIDTPPLALLADGNLLAAMVDAAVLVVGAGRTPYELIQHAVETIGRHRIVGVVLNRVVEEDGAASAYADGGSYHKYAHR
jgi:capsular exopolysaccharide synthesis family protein